MNKKRVLWLFCHSSLRNFEVPLLIEMGYEVFCPKSFDFEFGDRSASISYDYDRSLSIPKVILEKLNQTNFYESLGCETMAVLNEYFDIAFCMAAEEPIKSLIYRFSGVVILHAFGLFRDSGSYTDVFRNIIGLQGLNQISKLGNRFWFSQTYDNLSEIESDLLKRRSLFMPIAVSQKLDEKWVGGEKEFLFVGPKIKTNTYYHKVYENFKNDFGDMPHVIGGGQIVPVDDDKNVLGFLPKDQYVYNMTHLAAMFYHSQEPRHLHYHPLEAIEYGMPLVFMAGGMLDHLGGEKLPGRCRSIKEARRKLKKLSNGDKRLAARIIKSQRVLLESFREEYCRPFWHDAMKRIENAAVHKEIPKNRNVVVVVPAAYTGGVLDYAIRFCKSIKIGASKFGDQCNVTLAYPDDKAYDNIPELKSLKELDIKTRTYIPEIKDSAWVKRVYGLKGFDTQNTFCESVCLLNDGINHFSEFDYAFVMSDASPLSAPIYWEIPHTVVAHDYIQHYVPHLLPSEAIAIKMSNQRLADCVFVTSEPSYEDAISYAGLDKSKIRLTPYMLEISNTDLEKNEADTKDDFFLWSTNAARHKNHIRALKGISEYYRQGGKLKCYITGVNTKYFSENTNLEDAPVDIDYVNEIRELMSADSELKRNIHIMGNMEKSRYIDLLSNAKFIFHPGYGDNGNGTCFDAASLGVPSLVSDYPAMRYMGKFMNVPLHFMNPFETDNIAEALLDMERNYENYKNAIPSIKNLEKADYHEAGIELYKVIKEVADL